MNLEEKTIETKKIYSGRIINIRIDRVELPNRKITIREIAEHPGAAAIVPITADNDVILIEQYRTAAGKTLLEIPAGKLEKGEDPHNCAERELFEETSFKPGETEYLTRFYTSPGFCNEIIYLYLGKNVEKVSFQNNLQEDEFINIKKISIEKALEKVYKGEIIDSKTIIGLLTVGLLKYNYGN